MRLPIRSLLSSWRLGKRSSTDTGRRGLSGVTMRLVQFCRQGEEGAIRVGVQLDAGQGVVDLKHFDSALPSTMREFLQMGERGMEQAQRALSSGQCVVPLSEVRLLPPVTAPEKVVCVGMNYRDHCLEQNAPIPKEPIIFSKFPSAITGPYDDITLPEESEEVDWEVELAFVIGRKGRHIKEEEALSYVAGFTVANDVSARDWQMRRNGKQWLLGKTFDSFCPLGPALVTTAAIKDPHSLGICCRVNGITVQDSNTNQMIFRTEKLVAWVSQFVTLSPGDVFLTGTPPGVGVFRKPPVFLKKGDVVECKIDEIGLIRNAVV
ncbi:fumarylacetoacetate hydrolase domain-containing protein 2A isoform X2 [Conger conger]|nr:fumarylacetoacetate hydrolase domain-containing protein 2A isoform X2 [Conger conger]XP_061116087.1 fumarylacetoacetate hydrolase domain-containing protein 2A isoform X2 [Conger conger]XP_061116088.1 fumarylacetoacetate hydrolase domain-containing protein 2A isoform X2 [Conger conger]XP_061116089.1 fumarylacetoacetate hydrolase domain-containing protein 2A isoform X2 [Conger conger]XP_061116090.1 fumarylacetoacetate hydrolase domain-containing protein 2A isoform X2 [Conger conger]XP_0611160